MGAQIPNQNDLNVINKLDSRFSGQNLQRLRDFIRGPGGDSGFFAQGRHLDRISLRLQIWPDGLRSRWLGFLGKLLTNQQTAAQDGSTVAEVIRTALRNFVEDDNCTSIQFNAVHDNLPDGIDYHANIDQDYNNPPVQPYQATILLICRHEIPAGVTEPDPQADPGEQGMPPHP